MTYKSIIWQILFYGGLVVTALAQLTDPTAYGIPLAGMPYIKLLSLIAAIVGGKLGSSYLSGDPKPLAVDVTRAGKLLLLALLPSLLLVGCGAARQTPRHIATSAETSFKTAIVSFGQAEKAIYEAKLVPTLTLEKHRAINAKLVEIDDVGIRLTQVLLAWPEGAPTPAELKTLTGNVRWLVDEVATAFPDSPEKARLLGFLSTAQGWLLAIIAPAVPTHPDASALVAILEV